MNNHEDIFCIKCSCKEKIKFGFNKGLQRYKCKGCGYNFTSTASRGYPQELREKVIEWYLEESSLRSISRMFKINIATVINWVRKYGTKDNVQLEKK